MLLFLAVTLITIPCLMLITIGGVYQVIPEHLAYHKQVIETLGNRVLEQKLTHLFQLSVYGACAIAVVIGLMEILHPGEHLIRKSIGSEMDPWHTGLLLVIITVFGALRIVIAPLSAQSLERINPQDLPSLKKRMWSGVALVFFSGMVMLGVFTKHLPTMSLCGGILTALLVYVKIETRKLGREAGAKTPWPVLAALAASSLAGSILAFVQI